MATVPVVRMVSLISLRSTIPNFTPMDCRRSGESWMGDSGVSVDGGGAAEVLISCWGAGLEAGGAAVFVPTGWWDLHQKPASTPTRARFATSAKLNAVR